MTVSLIAGIVLLSGGVDARKKKPNAAAAAATSQNALPDLSDFERGRRRKRKKVIPVKRFNYLFAKLQQFQRNNLESAHKKMGNKSRKLKAVALKNLGTMRNRQPRCMPVSESQKFKRQQIQKYRQAKAETNRLEKKARVEVARAEKREAAEHRRSLKRMSDLDLFERDFVERRKRDTTNATTTTMTPDMYDVNELDWDYYEYYYGEEDNYEVDIGDFDTEFNQAYPDYVAPPGFGTGIQARGRRRGKKKGKGKKLGPIKTFFNITQSIKQFIAQELKSCARQDVYQRRLQRLVNNIKQNAPILTKPPPKPKGKGKKGKKSTRAERRQNRNKNRG